MPPKRIKANDPAAMVDMGLYLSEKGDYEGAFEYLTKAAELGDVDAHFNLSVMYGEGKGAEKDEKKQVYHLEEAAIGGHPDARNNLGYYEGMNGQINRAMKHYIIAAKLGLGPALDQIKDGFKEGSVSKEDYEAALRGYQTAVDATKSAEREEAEAAHARKEEEMREMEFVHAMLMASDNLEDARRGIRPSNETFASTIRVLFCL